MKKIIALLLALVFMFSAAACTLDEIKDNIPDLNSSDTENGNEEQRETDDTAGKKDEENEEDNEDPEEKDNGKDKDEEQRPPKTDYFDYNGKLHVEGAYIVNQYNEPIQLNGVNCPFAYNENNQYTTWANLDRFTLLKDWGFNFIRIGLNVTKPYSQAAFDAISKILDYLIELGMYAEILAANDETRMSNTDGIAKAKELLGYFANKYKDYDNFLYSVGNEPKADIKMAELDEYTTEVMSEVFKYKSDAIIVVPTPCADAEVDDCVYSTIEYPNVVYVAHCYMSEKAKGYDLYRRVITAHAAGKALYVSEWSAASASTSSTFVDTDEAKNLLYLINKYKIANCYYAYFPGGDTLDDTWQVSSLGMIKRYWWDTRYREDSALTISGKFRVETLKNNTTEISGVTEEDCYVMENRGKGGVFYFWAANYREKIKKIRFTNTHVIPNDRIDVWCLSLKGLGEIVAYLTEDEEGYYGLTFMSDKVMIFPEDSSFYFYKFNALESIVFDNVDTSHVKNFTSFFNGCKQLKEVDLSMFDFSSAETLCDMFINTAVKKVSFGDADFGKVVLTSSMFYGVTPTVYVKNEAARDVLLKEKKTLKIIVEK